MANLLIPSTDWATATTIDAGDLNTLQTEISASFRLLGVGHPTFVAGVGNTFACIAPSGTVELPNITNVEYHDTVVPPSVVDVCTDIDDRVTVLQIGNTPTAEFALKTSIVIPWTGGVVGWEVSIEIKYANQIVVMFGGKAGGIAIQEDMYVPSSFKFYERGGSTPNGSGEFRYDDHYDIPAREPNYDYSHPALKPGLFACLQINTLYGGYDPRQVAMQSWGDNSGWVSKSRDENGLIASVAPTSEQWPKGLQLCRDANLGMFGYYNYGNGTVPVIHLDLFADNGGSGPFHFLDSYTSTRTSGSYGNSDMAELKAADPTGTWFVVGVPFGKGGANADGESGAGYIMVVKRTTNFLSLNGYYNDATGGRNEFFGESVDFLDADTMLVTNKLGDVIRFERSFEDWVQVSKIDAPYTFPYIDFGVHMTQGCTENDHVYPYQHFYDKNPGFVYLDNFDNGLTTIVSPYAPDADPDTRWAPAPGCDIKKGLYGETLAVCWMLVNDKWTLGNPLPELGSDTVIQIYDKPMVQPAPPVIPQ
mgnify:CR=1 FL=1